MMQLFEDVSGTLALLFLSIIGWIISKWTHGRFAASSRSREAELAKLQKIGADSDTLITESENGEHDAPLVRSNLDGIVPEKSLRSGVQNRRRVRRRAKVAKLEADVRAVESEFVMSSQGETSDTFTSHLEQDRVSAVVVASTVNTEEQIDEFQTDLVVSVPEAKADPSLAKEVLSEEEHRDADVLSAHEALRTQRSETGLSEETRLSQRSMGSYQAGEEKEKQDASSQSGSSTHGDAQETVSSEDDSMLSKSSLASASQEASEPTPSIPTYPPWMSSADSRFPIHGDGWMTSFGELEFAQSSGEAVFTRSIDAQGSKSYTEGELVYESTEQTPVAAIHRERAFVIEGRVFTPFMDVHGQHLYTDGKIVYHATSVLANATLTRGPNCEGEQI